jgi:alkylhydroperoxidase family enzyme
LQDPNPDLHSCLARRELDAAPVSESERALLEFARLVTEHAYRTTDADVESLRAQGWTDPQIAECVYITALFAFFNRVADAFGLDDPHGSDPPNQLRGEPEP